MKLSFPLPLQQLLFIFFAALLAAPLPSALAQQDAYVFTKAAPQQPVVMKVLGVKGSALMVRGQYGEQGIPLAQIQEVRMAEPPESAAAIEAFKAKDWGKALAQAKAVADRFKGLPAAWAVTATAMIGNIYLEQGDIAKAKAAFDDFARAYPGNGEADLGRARIAVANKEYDAARKTAAPICEKALKDAVVKPQDGPIYSQAFLVMGQVKEAANDFQGALEDYLRTVSLFYYDPAAVSIAQAKADALRKQHAVFVP